MGAVQRAILDLIDETGSLGTTGHEPEERSAEMSDTNGPLTCDAWVVTKLGDPAAVLERQQVEVPAPGPNEIRVAVETFCLNFNDIDVIRGRYLTLPLEAPFVPGMESVGMVESAGAGAEHLLGQRIVGIPVMAHGGYATHAIVDSATAFGIPASMSSVDGAAMHYPFHLGWFALHERARLQPGETLLVHAGAGGTGSGAIQIGKALGARVIATAGTDEKVKYCRDSVRTMRSTTAARISSPRSRSSPTGVAWTWRSTRSVVTSPCRPSSAWASTVGISSRGGARTSSSSTRATSRRGRSRTGTSRSAGCAWCT